MTAAAKRHFPPARAAILSRPAPPAFVRGKPPERTLEDLAVALCDRHPDAVRQILRGQEVLRSLQYQLQDSARALGVDDHQRRANEALFSELSRRQG